MLFRPKILRSLNLLVVLVVLVSACSAPAAAPEQLAAAAPATAAAAPATAAPAAAAPAAGPVLMDTAPALGTVPTRMKIFNSPAEAGGIAEFHEAPELTDLVAKGELPPLAERLPTNPLVVQPEETVGKYGGTLHMMIPPDFARSVEVSNWQYEMLLTPSPIDGQMLPSLAESFEWNDDSTVLTLKLRQGIKWSDGVPYTADDIMFWWNDVILNKELSPGTPALLSRAGELAKLTKIDDFTVQYTFAAPYALFTTYLGSWGFPCTEAAGFPKHYLSQFHPTYTPVAEVEAKMKENSFDTWVDAFQAMSILGNESVNPDLPTLGAWILNEKPPQQLQTYRRNPYYWKVDTAGNQLPYIGDIRTTRTGDGEASLLKAMAGEIDVVGIGWLGGPKNLGLLDENMGKGEYRYTYGNWMPNSAGNIMFNYTSGDEAKQELYKKKEFRQALSVAINREEIIKVEYKGGVFASQVAPAPGAPYFGESDLFKSWTQHDPDLANKMLDELGLTKRGADGFRLLPNGKDLLLIISANTSWPPETADLQELVRGYWAVVGINAKVAPEEGTLWWTRHDNGEHDLSSRASHFGGGPVHPTLNENTFALSGVSWAPEWAKWMDMKGAEGVEPPAEVKRIREIHDLVLGESDDAKRVELINEVFKIHMDNLFTIGLTVGDIKIGQRQLFRNRVRNVPTQLFTGESYPNVPATYFINE